MTYNTYSKATDNTLRELFMLNTARAGNRFIVKGNGDNTVKNKFFTDKIVLTPKFTGVGSMEDHYGTTYNKNRSNNCRRGKL